MAFPMSLDGNPILPAVQAPDLGVIIDSCLSLIGLIFEGLLWTLESHQFVRIPSAASLAQATIFMQTHPYRATLLISSHFTDETLLIAPHGLKRRLNCSLWVLSCRTV